MVDISSKHKGIEDFETYYTTEVRISSFQKHIILSCYCDEDWVILEACSKVKKG